MCLLRSYSYGHVHGFTELPKEVLNLFIGLTENPEKRVEFASEIISAGLQGNIDFTRQFNLEAYEATIHKNIRLGQENRRKREVFLDYTDTSDGWEDTARDGGIKIDVATQQRVDKMEDAYEQLLLEDELKYAVSTIKSLQHVLLIEERLDLLHTIKQALKGIPESESMLTRVCKKYEVVAEQVYAILNSGYAFEELFA